MYMIFLIKKKYYQIGDEIIKKFPVNIGGIDEDNYMRR